MGRFGNCLLILNIAMTNTPLIAAAIQSSGNLYVIIYLLFPRLTAVDWRDLLSAYGTNY
jgi:hypothetical protein